MRAEAIRAWLVREVARAARADPSEIDVRAPFDSFGLGSLDAVALSGDLADLLGRELSPTLVYEHPSIESLARFLGEPAGTPSPDQSRDAHAEAGSLPVAIVGIACRFPGADGPEAFWQLLREGVDAIREVPPDRWDADAYYHADPAVPGKAATRWGGFLDQVDRFDPFFFGISPGEAERMDPQQRLLLELAYEAFEDAGRVMPSLAGSRTGVLVGISLNEYSLLQHGRHHLLNGHSATGAALSIAANRISYFFDLRGPSLAVDTACSSSLMAVHLACRSLAAGECDLALAGGVNLILSPAHSIAFTKAGVLAPDGRCKTFDASANGYVRGEGGGLLVLKPLARALAEGDRIHAVIRGSAVLQDGRTNGLMAPNREAQEAVLRAAYHEAGVNPADVHYVEAHGTGTLLGDSMEARALGAVLSVGRRDGPCALGSVKSNLGHLEAAAGVAGLIKVALALKYRGLPPTLHFKTPNPQVPFEALGLRVQQEFAPWPAHAGSALAAVSSFGFGGTNVHMVLEEAPAMPSVTATPASGMAHLIPLSARTGDALTEVARRFRAFVRDAAAGSAPGIAEIAASAALRRTHLDCRLAVIARSREELIDRLDRHLRGDQHPEALSGGDARPEATRLAFVFSGQGSQSTGMGRELTRSEPAFRSAIERCSEALEPLLGWSLLEQLRGSAPAELEEIDAIQPALFAMQVALAALWRSWGIEPDLVLGHSMGEVAAAHVAGALTLEDAARVIVVRSRLLKRLSGQGGMMVVGLSSEETNAQLSRIGPGLAIAARNGPRTTVVAGAAETLDSLGSELEAQGIFCRRVKVDVAAHGPQALPLAEELRGELPGLAPRSSTVAFISAVTGSVLDGSDLGPDYWARNLIEPVNFAGAVVEALRGGGCDFIEMSPHPLLQGAVQQSLIQEGREGHVLASLRRGEDERSAMLQSLATLYVSARPVAWGRICGGDHPPVALPAYPWQRQRYWLDPTTGNGRVPGAAHVRGATGAHPLLGHRIALAREPKTHIWEAELQPETEPFLGDHRVDGELILPGSAVIDMALSAAAEADLANGAELRDVAFARRLVLPLEGATTVQAVLSPTEGGPAFGLYSLPNRTGPEEWTLHATATVTPAAAESGGRPSVSLADLQTRCTEAVRPELLYRSLADRGLEYGPAMQAITGVWHGTGEAIGHLSLPEPLHARAEAYRIHPVLLDAALQTLAAIPEPAASDPESSFRPVGCRRMRLRRRAGTTLWSHVALRSTSGAGGELVADVSLFDESGEPVGELDEFRLVRVPRARTDTAGPADISLYQLQWRETTTDTASAALKGQQISGRWLIVADDTDVAHELARELASRGQSCQLVQPDQAGAGPRSHNGTGDPLDDLIDAGFAGERGELRGVVSLCAGGPAAPSDDPFSCAAALALSRRLAASAGTIRTPRLWLVTRGAQAVMTGETVMLAQAPLWGLVKSIAFELPQFQWTLLDLDPACPAPQSAWALACELLAGDSEDHVALRGGRRLVARVVPYRLPSSRRSCSGREAAAPSLDPAGTYLITGGLGGLGLAVGRWMVERGARNLVLVGRTAPSGAKDRALQTMRTAGAEVVFERADVARAEEVEATLARIRAAMPPLRGVIHAAGVLDNAPVVSLDQDRFRRVMAPKVSGAWNLHLATRDDALDWFVLFSSAVSVLGSPGQGNYSAANAFLDALAHRRRAEGRPAISINWGPWEEVGLVADGNFIGSRPGSGDRGVKGIAPVRGLELLGALLHSDDPQVVALPFDLPSLLDLYPQAARIPRFAEVGGKESHVSRLYARPRLRQAYLAPRNDIEARLAEMWRQTLRIDRVGVRDSFFELGGDSVLAAQLVASAHRAFGVDLDLREAFKAFTIESLAERVEAALVARLDQMSEAEVERLLQER